MPNPKSLKTVKRVAGPLRAVTLASSASVYPKYFVVCVDNKEAEAILLQQLRVVPVPVAPGRLAMEAQRVIQTAMSGSGTC